MFSAVEKPGQTKDIVDRLHNYHSRKNWAPTPAEFDARYGLIVVTTYNSALADDTTDVYTLSLADEHRADILGERKYFTFRDGEGAAGTGTAGDATIRVRVAQDEEALMALLARCDEALEAGDFATLMVGRHDVAACRGSYAPCCRNIAAIIAAVCGPTKEASTRTSALSTSRPSVSYVASVRSLDHFFRRTTMLVIVPTFTTQDQIAV